MPPTGAEIVESIRQIQSERDALLDLLARVQDRVGVVLPADLAAEVNAHLS